MEESPEVVPLDDPLYENLRRNKNKLKTSTTNDSSSSSSINNAHNRISNTAETKRETKTVKENQIKFIKTDDLVIDDKLDLNDDQDRLKIKDIQDPLKGIKGNIDNNLSALKEQETLNVKSVGNTNNMEIRKDGTIGVDTREKGTEPHGLLEITNNSHKEAYIHNSHVIPSENLEIKDKVAIEPHSSIQVEDSNVNHKKVESQNFADFHVIDSEKDLEVPSGMEGPIPSVVLPPPNFVPPPNLDPENSSPQYDSPLFELNDKPEEKQTKVQNYWIMVDKNWPQEQKQFQSQYVSPNTFSPLFSPSSSLETLIVADDDVAN